MTQEQVTSLIQSLVSRYDPRINTDIYSDFYNTVISPLVEQFAIDPDTDLTEFVKQKLKEFFPELMIDYEGSPLGDILVKAASLIFEPLRQVLQQIELEQEALSRPELFDNSVIRKIADSWFVNVRDGTHATVTVNLYFSKEVNVQITRLMRFYTNKDLGFRPIEEKIYTSTKSGNYYVVSVDCISEGTGSIYNVPANTIIYTDTYLDYLSKITNPQPASGGQDPDSNAIIVNNILESLSGKNLGSVRGIKNLLLDNFSDIDSVYVARNEGLKRDVIDFRVEVKDPKFDVVFAGNISNFSGDNLDKDYKVLTIPSNIDIIPDFHKIIIPVGNNFRTYDIISSRGIGNNLYKIILAERHIKLFKYPFYFEQEEQDGIKTFFSNRLKTNNSAVFNLANIKTLDDLYGYFEENNQDEIPFIKSKILNVGDSEITIDDTAKIIFSGPAEIIIDNDGNVTIRIHVGSDKLDLKAGDIMVLVEDSSNKLPLWLSFRIPNKFRWTTDGYLEITAAGKDNNNNDVVYIYEIFGSLQYQTAIVDNPDMQNVSFTSPMKCLLIKSSQIHTAIYNYLLNSNNYFSRSKNCELEIPVFATIEHNYIDNKTVFEIPDNEFSSLPGKPFVLIEPSKSSYYEIYSDDFNKKTGNTADIFVSGSEKNFDFETNILNFGDNYLAGYFDASEKFSPNFGNLNNENYYISITQIEPSQQNDFSFKRKLLGETGFDNTESVGIKVSNYYTIFPFQEVVWAGLADVTAGTNQITLKNTTNLKSEILENSQYKIQVFYPGSRPLNIEKLIIQEDMATVLTDELFSGTYSNQYAFIFKSKNIENAIINVNSIKTSAGDINPGLPVDIQVASDFVNGVGKVRLYFKEPVLFILRENDYLISSSGLKFYPFRTEKYPYYQVLLKNQKEQLSNDNKNFLRPFVRSQSDKDPWKIFVRYKTKGIISNKTFVSSDQFDFAGLNFKLKINGNVKTHIFSGTGPLKINEIIEQLNKTFGGIFSLENDVINIISPDEIEVVQSDTNLILGFPEDSKNTEIIYQLITLEKINSTYNYTRYFDVIIPVGTTIYPDELEFDEELNLYYADIYVWAEDFYKVYCDYKWELLGSKINDFLNNSDKFLFSEIGWKKLAINPSPEYDLKTGEKLKIGSDIMLFGFVEKTENEYLSFSTKEFFNLKIPVVFCSQGNSLADLKITPAEPLTINYFGSDLVKNIQDYISYSEDRLICTDYLVRNKFPIILTGKIQYSGNVSPDVIKNEFEKYLKNINRTSNYIDFSMVKLFLASQNVTDYVDPTKITAIRINPDRTREVSFIYDRIYKAQNEFFVSEIEFENV
jgi:hypothetical protein